MPSPETTYVQIEYMLMELIQKNFYLREARSMMEMTDRSRMRNDLHDFIEKMELERDALKRRINNAKYPED